MKNAKFPPRRSIIEFCHFELRIDIGAFPIHAH